MTQFKFIIHFFIPLLFALSCSTINHTNTDEEKEQEIVLKNKIKSITEYKTIFHLGIQEKEIPSHVKTFNIAGFKTNETNYNSDESVEFLISHKYDNNGNIILTTGLGSESNLLFKITRSYDEDNNRKDFVSHLPDGTFKYKNTAAYDKAGRMIELVWYRPDGLKAINKFRYDGRKKIEDAEYDPSGKFQYRWIYKYDGKENLIEATQYAPDNTTNCKINSEYNRDNQILKQISYIGESIQSTTTFEYDKKKLLIFKTEYSATGKIEAKFRYLYEFF